MEEKIIKVYVMHGCNCGCNCGCGCCNYEQEPEKPEMKKGRKKK